MSRNHRSDAAILRQHLLVTLGLGAVGTGCWVVPGGCENPTYVTTVDLVAQRDTGSADTADTGAPAEAPTTCPDSWEAAYLIEGSGQEGDHCQDEITLLEQDGDQCTYEHMCWSCCAYGRPYLDEDGQPVESPTAPTDRWREPVVVPIDTLSAEEREALAGFWLHNARAEHSSVAGFHRFALDLLAHGAPPELLLRVQHAAAQEVRHAVTCFSLASVYGGEAVGPAPMELGERAPIASSLAELAVWTLRDGAVGETLAAYLAQRALEHTTAPAARRALEEIVRDETQHAELAWATLRWALELGGDEVAVAIRGFLAKLGPPERRSDRWTPAMGAHGWLSPDDEHEAARTCLAEVVLPVAEALLDAVAQAA